MDYYLDPTIQYPFAQPTYHMGKNRGMLILEHVFDPSGTRISTLRDCVLISLDTEYEPCAKRVQQVGLAVLDTRDIQKADLNDSMTGIIASRLLILERQKKYRGTYLFGTPDKHYDANLENLLRLSFTITDTKDTCKLRNIILVGHGIRTDIEIIKSSCGLDLLSLPMIKTVIDTSQLLNSVYHIAGRSHSLRRTCTYMGMYRRNMHNAGNDAMYTLKALLLIFYHYKDQKLPFEVMDGATDQALLYECQLEAIKKIGRWNNGISRFRGKRRIKLHGDELRGNENKARRPGLLDLDDGGEEGVISCLFGAD